MHLLGCLFFLFFGIVFLIINAARNIYDAAFGRRSQQRQNGWQDVNSSRTKGKAQPGGQNSNGNSRQRRRKLFEDGEGEYVDFVEVRD